MAKEKKQKKTKTNIDVLGFSVKDLGRMLSDIEFLSRIEISEANSRQICVQGRERLYTLNYRLIDYNVDENDFVDITPSTSEIVSDKNYTHSQLRDMKSAERRKHS